LDAKEGLFWLQIPGRMSDSAVAGAGAFADSAVGACGSTGDGDIHLRFLPCYQARQNSMIPTCS
jgi:N4-(beta-N-acetylglucosaminyl)-L-asparaginase